MRWVEMGGGGNKKMVSGVSGGKNVALGGSVMEKVVIGVEGIR